MAIGARLRRLLAPSPARVSLQIATDRVTGVALGRGAREVTAVSTASLPEGVLIASANASNLGDRAAVEAAVRHVLDALPGSPGRLALVVPDSAAKVSLTSFKQIPSRSADLKELVRWQARKTAPFVWSRHIRFDRADRGLALRWKHNHHEHRTKDKLQAELEEMRSKSLEQNLISLNAAVTACGL